MRYAIATAIGCVIFVLIGYFVLNSSADASGGFEFGFYLSHPSSFRWYWWLVIGGAIGAGCLYLFDTKVR